MLGVYVLGPSTGSQHCNDYDLFPDPQPLTPLEQLFLQEALVLRDFYPRVSGRDAGVLGIPPRLEAAGTLGRGTRAQESVPLIVS